MLDGWRGGLCWLLTFHPYPRQAYVVEKIYRAISMLRLASRRVFELQILGAFVRQAALPYQSASTSRRQKQREQDRYTSTKSRASAHDGRRKIVQVLNLLFMHRHHACKFAAFLPASTRQRQNACLRIYEMLAVPVAMRTNHTEYHLELRRCQVSVIYVPHSCTNLDPVYAVARIREKY
eukprot:2064124-Pleurochrysis_carterae.AAC.1